MVFEALSRTANVNIILDRDVKSDLKTTIYVKDASVEDTIDLTLLKNQLEKRVLNDNTVFVYPAMAAKQKDYNELTVKSFQLSNVEAAHVANLIKSLLKTRTSSSTSEPTRWSCATPRSDRRLAEKLVAPPTTWPTPKSCSRWRCSRSRRPHADLGIHWPDRCSLSTPSRRHRRRAHRR